MATRADFGRESRTDGNLNKWQFVVVSARKLTVSIRPIPVIATTSGQCLRRVDDLPLQGRNLPRPSTQYHRGCERTGTFWATPEVRTDRQPRPTEGAHRDGSDTARFSRFLASPYVVTRHLARLFRREPDMQVGHNPAGGWMVLLLLALLLGGTLTGIVDNNDVADEGPLSHAVPAMVLNLITDLHSLLWNALPAAALLHVMAISIYAVAKGQKPAAAHAQWPQTASRSDHPTARHLPGACQCRARR
jgi:hypothetical protein